MLPVFKNISAAIIHNVYMKIIHPILILHFTVAKSGQVSSRFPLHSIPVKITCTPGMS